MADQKGPLYGSKEFQVVSLPAGRHYHRGDEPSGVWVCGDHRDTASIQGALVSGRRTAAAILDTMRARRAVAG
jgi:hypothetical protein